MILFLEDWNKVENITAIPHETTSNRTWVRQAEIYRQMGIKNHNFLLALHDPSIQYLDPYSPNLTEEQKIAIATECEVNPWYAVREVIRLPAIGGPDPIRISANRANISMYWSFFNHIDYFLIQMRQTGKSVNLESLITWLMFSGLMNGQISYLTKDDKLRIQNLSKLKEMRDVLPGYIYPANRNDAANQTQMTCGLRKNTYTAHVGQPSLQGAMKVGRGASTAVFIGDEGPYTSNFRNIVPTALSGSGAAREEAERYGQPYGNVFATTAGKQDEPDGGYFYMLLQEAARFEELMYDAENIDVLKEIILANSHRADGERAATPALNGTWSHRQLGRTDEWLMNRIATSRARGDDADRDFFNVWTAGSESSPLPAKALEAIKRSEMGTTNAEISPIGRYILRWYTPGQSVAERMSDGHYVMGIDMSEASGGDNITVVITDIRDLSVVAAGTYNETNTIVFNKFILSLLVRFPNITLVIEKKSLAQSLIDYMILMLPLEGYDPFKRMYNRIIDEQDVRRNDYKVVGTDYRRRTDEVYNQYKGLFGFNTTGSSRNLLYGNVLQNAAKQSGHLVRDVSLSGELRGLVTRNGRVDHALGAHDDHVIAWLLTHWFISETKYLQSYGIDRMDVKALVGQDGEEISDEDIARREEARVLRGQVDDVCEELKRADHPFIIQKLEHKLGLLNSRLSTFSGEPLSMDELLRTIREERHSRARQRASSRWNSQ